MRRDVVVVGGGLAGIACALDCAAGGARVALLEVRRRLGGAVYSYERDGISIDNGQHVFLRRYEAYRGLLQRLGAAASVSVQPRFEIPILSPGHAPTVLRRSLLPAPLQLGGALARYPLLTVRERLAAARTALALVRADPRSSELERITLGQWLARHGQDERSVAALWDLIALPSLNLRAAEASAAMGVFVFRTGLLESASGGDIGFHERPQSEVIDIPARRELRRAGVEVVLGARVGRIARAADGFELTCEGEREPLRAGSVVVAVPHMRAATLLAELLPATARDLVQMGTTPIVNVHVVYDRRVCDWSFAGGVDTPVQYLFDRSAVAGVPRGHQYLAVSLSGAEEEMRMSAEQLRDRYLTALCELFPRARGANVERFFATKEHAATFRAVPGIARLRPGARTDVAGLVLAGAWTDTGWPATLEGAVLSGHTAAREVLGTALSGSRRAVSDASEEHATSPPVAGTAPSP